MEYKTNNQEPRFFCAKIVDISKIQIDQFGQKQLKINQKQFKVIFQVGSKKSSSQFKGYKSDKKQDNLNINLKSVRNQLHIFPYEYEQVMSIKLILNQRHEKYGYSLMPLNPLIKIPHTCHQIEMNLIFQTDKKEIINIRSAILKIQFFYMLKFQGILFIQPLQAHLTKNQAFLGQMKPYIKFKIKDKVLESKTIEEGGIRPIWKQKMSPQHQILAFSIQSAAIQLQISVNSLSSIGNSQNQVGYAVVKIQDKQIFKYSESIAILTKSFLKDIDKIQKDKNSKRDKNPEKQTLKEVQQQQKTLKLSAQFKKELEKVLSEGSDSLKFNDIYNKNKGKYKQIQHKNGQIQNLKSYFVVKMLKQKQIQLKSYDEEQEMQYDSGILKINMGFIYTFQLDQNDNFTYE